MTVQNAQYLCPICASSLGYSEKVFRCASNHCFDLAKEGYVNLLPVQFKHSKDPGDNKEMVNARRSFLEKGFYKPLIESITLLYEKYGKVNGNVLDAGCGEGYYTNQHKNESNSVYGVDIAKTAIKVASKKYKNCHFSVGTLSKLPFEESMFDWIYSIYAPILENEFTRVLKKNGYLLTVTPADNHLFELKSLIYREAKQHDTSKSPIKNLEIVEEKRINYVIEFENSEDIINLLSMTPFAFKTTQELLNHLRSLSTFKCQADFLVRLYKAN